MPAIMLKNIAAGTADALTGLKFKVQNRPSLVSLWATTPTAGGTVSLSVGNQEIVVNAQSNIESSADVVDTDRDQILFRERVPPGEFFLPVNTQIGNVLLLIEPL